jgi:hypothetical protein
LSFSFALEYTINKIQENQEWWEFSSTYQLLAYANDVNFLGENVNVVRKITETLLDSSKYLFMSCC